MDRDVNISRFLRLSRSVVRVKELFEKIVDDLIRVIGGSGRFSVEEFERFKDLVFELVVFIVAVELWLGEEGKTPVEYNGGFLYRDNKNGRDGNVA